MRKLIQRSTVLLALTLAGAAAHAQAAPDQGPPPDHRTFDHRGPGRGPNPEFEAKMLTRRLQLSPEQEAQITPILAEQHEQLKALRPAPGSRPADGEKPDFKAMHEQTKAIMDSTREKLEAVLTPEQKEKLEKMHEHGPRGPGGPGGPRGEHRPPPPASATPSA
jgi:Spy/CpxP family protein refolding chaperone